MDSRLLIYGRLVQLLDLRVWALWCAAQKKMKSALMETVSRQLRTVKPGDVKPLTTKNIGWPCLASGWPCLAADWSCPVSD
jgi:hypothetical protein